VVKWLGVTILIVYMACGFTLNVLRYLNHIAVSGIVQTVGQCLSFPISSHGLSNDFILILLQIINDVNNNHICSIITMI